MLVPAQLKRRQETNNQQHNIIVQGDLEDDIIISNWLIRGGNLRKLLYSQIGLPDQQKQMRATILQRAIRAKLLPDEYLWISQQNSYTTKDGQLQQLPVMTSDVVINAYWDALRYEFELLQKQQMSNTPVATPFTTAPPPSSIEPRIDRLKLDELAIEVRTNGVSMAFGYATGIDNAGFQPRDIYFGGVGAVDPQHNLVRSYQTIFQPYMNIIADLAKDNRPTTTDVMICANYDPSTDFVYNNGRGGIYHVGALNTNTGPLGVLAFGFTHNRGDNRPSYHGMVFLALPLDLRDCILRELKIDNVTTGVGKEWPQLLQAIFPNMITTDPSTSERNTRLWLPRETTYEINLYDVRKKGKPINKIIPYN
ncbi:MAG: hypothetical protein WCO06_05705 [Candidatus Roizmanbacteria bacterium]